MIKRILNIVLIVLIANVTIAQTVEQDVYWRALNYVNNNQPDSALMKLQSQPDCEVCFKLKAGIYIEKNDAFKAIKLYKEIAKTEPGEAYFMLSVIYAGMGFADESVAYLSKHFDYPNPKTYSEILSYNDFDKINTSSEWREFWSEERYSENALKLEEAEYLIKSEDYNSALSILESLNYRSQRENIYCLIAGIYISYENISQAMNFLNLALEYDKDYLPALILKRNVENVDQSFQAAILTNDLIIKSDPYNPYHIRKHAELLYNFDKPLEAETYIDLYLKYFSNDEQANHLKTQILSGGEDYRQALINLNILIDQNPSKADYFVERADIYYKLESWRFASNDYSMALDIDPELDRVWYHYGMCQYNLNNEKKACNAWQKAANMKNRDAAKMLFEVCGE